MAIHKTIERFDDKNGHGGTYEVGDLYLHEDRFEVLSTDKNQVKRPVTKEMTVEDLKEELNKRKIDFDAKAKKEELEKLLLSEVKK